jgi:hypothetical protein
MRRWRSVSVVPIALMQSMTPCASAVRVCAVAASTFGVVAVASEFSVDWKSTFGEPDGGAGLIHVDGDVAASHEDVRGQLRVEWVGASDVHMAAGSSRDRRGRAADAARPGGADGPARR